LLQGKRKHKRKHKKKKILVLVLVLALMPLRQDRFYGEIRIIVFALVLALVLASLVKTRLKIVAYCLALKVFTRNKSIG